MKRPEYHIIVNVFKGDADRKERELVAAWIRYATANQLAFQKLKTIWEHYGKHHESYFVATYLDSQKLEANISSSSKKRRLLYQVAASVMLLCTLSIVTYQLVVPSFSGKVAHFSRQDGKKVILPDGSLVVLKAESEITLASDFNQNTRSLTLRGGAYFEVTPDKNKPFIIKNEEVTINVLGTSFLVTPFSDRKEVALFSGEVALHTSKGHINLKPDQTAIIGDQLSKKDGIDSHALFWKRKTLHFQDKQLDDVFNTLERHYSVVIDHPKEMKDKRLTATFQHQTIDEVLSVICTVHHLEVRKKTTNHYYLLQK